MENMTYLSNHYQFSDFYHQSHSYHQTTCRKSTWKIRVWTLCTYILHIHITQRINKYAFSSDSSVKQTQTKTDKQPNWGRNWNTRRWL